MRVGFEAGAIQEENSVACGRWLVESCVGEWCGAGWQQRMQMRLVC